MRKKRSFTLIEILVVTTIIALLTSAATVTYTQLGKQSRDSKRKADIEQIRAALEMYRSNSVTNVYSAYSGDCSSYTALVAPTKYIASMPSDPKTGYNYCCEITTTDYTIGAYLETTSTGSCGSCGTSNCNYCVGPYGQE